MPSTNYISSDESLARVVMDARPNPGGRFEKFIPPARQSEVRVDYTDNARA
jgi:hypothetical protein